MQLRNLRIDGNTVPPRNKKPRPQELAHDFPLSTSHTCGPRVSPRYPLTEDMGPKPSKAAAAARGTDLLLKLNKSDTSGD